MCFRPQLFQDSKGLVAFSNSQQHRHAQKSRINYPEWLFITTNTDKYALLQNHFHLF